MKKKLNMIEKITLVFAVISIGGFICTSVVFELLRRRVVSGIDIPAFLDKISLPAFFAYALFFIFHLLAILTVILQLKFFKMESFFRSFVFFASTMSLLMLFGDYALLSDISKEYMFGFPREFYILFLSQGLHIVFSVSLLALILRSAKPGAHIEEGKEGKIPGEEQIVLKDEATFINSQYVGILTGVSGIIVVSVAAIYTELWVLWKGIIVISIIMAVPYAAIVLYWLILKSREKLTEWYDEKQFQDLAKSGIIALVVSMITLAILYGFQYAFKNPDLASLIWFPLYFFLVLLLFSATTLFFNKRG